MKGFSNKVIVYKDDSDNAILTLQDLPIRAGDSEECRANSDDNFDPDEIIGYVTVAADYEE